MKLGSKFAKTDNLLAPRRALEMRKFQFAKNSKVGSCDAENESTESSLRPRCESAGHFSDRLKGGKKQCRKLEAHHVNSTQ